MRSTSISAVGQVRQHRLPQSGLQDKEEDRCRTLRHRSWLSELGLDDEGCVGGGHRLWEWGGVQSAWSRESKPRRPLTTAKTTTAAKTSSAIISDPPLTTGGTGGTGFALGLGLAAKVSDVLVGQQGAVVEKRLVHAVLPFR
jgi:hypothetical protein